MSEKSNISPPQPDGARPLEGQPSASDLDLLRAYEPILCFSKGELFFPTAVGPYVAHCSLWSKVDAKSSCMVPNGRLTLDRLQEEALARRDQQLSLRFVELPLTRAEYRQWRREPREHLVKAVRFTTTGIFGRLLDAAFRASLLLRGKVAAGLAAAAEIAYREKLEADRFTYYGRVRRTGGYVCLQYWFFYPMNDWRSTFSGVNDHEADWEMATVYLAERSDGHDRPAWVALASHDHHGDDLRRRWDDPELRRDGNHPLLFVGAGSHSGAFVPGDYVITVNPPLVQKAVAAVRRAERALSPWREDTRPAGLGIPFVDYARGDGKVIGPGQQTQWTATLIDDRTPWVHGYRGLWGLDTEDRFGGERAPSGPRYERDGTIRPAWANPLGWSGLEKVPPDEEGFAGLLAERTATLEHRLRQLDERIDDERAELRRTSAEVRSLEAHDHTRKLARKCAAERDELEKKLNATIADRVSLDEELRTHRDTLKRPLPAPEPQDHVKTRHGPRTEEQQRRARFLRVWAAVSTPLLLAMVPVILLARPLTWVTTLIAITLLFIGVEAFARRRFLSFLGSVLLLAAIVAALVGFVALFHYHWRIAVSVLFAAAAVLLLAGNLGDIGRGRPRGRSAGEVDDE
jgi:hypothetical protein